jgi:hypothetical protein
MNFISLLCVGLLAGIPCILFAIEAYSQLRKLMDIIATPTTKIFDIKRNPRAYLDKQVEVTGYINREKHLKAPYTGETCICYWVRERNRVKTVSTSGGKRSVTYSYKDVYNTRSTESFFIQDHSERLLVDPLGFEVDGVKTFNKKEAIKPLTDDRSLFDAIFKPTPAGSTVVGKWREEMILPPMRKAYVIGILRKRFEKIDGERQEVFYIEGHNQGGAAITGIVSLRTEAGVRLSKFLSFLGNFTVALVLFLIVIWVVLIQLKEMGMF